MNILYISKHLETQLIYPLPIFLFNLSNWKRRTVPFKVNSNWADYCVGVEMEMHLIEAPEGELYGLDVCIYRTVNIWKKMYGIDRTCSGVATIEEKIGNVLYQYWMNHYIERYHNEYPFLQLDQNRGQQKKLDKQLIRQLKVLPPFFRRKMVLEDNVKSTWATKYEKLIIRTVKRNLLCTKREKNDHSRRIYGA